MKTAADTEPPMVLVVDDDAIVRIAAREYLEDAGFRVVAAADGAAGLECFARQEVDAVVLDIWMPGMNGFEVCERIRGAADGDHVPILLVTGTGDVDSVNRAFHCGATDFSAKPLDFELLVHRIRYMLRASRAHADLRAREASLAYAQRIARLGNWEYDIEAGRLHLSEQLAEMVGASERVYSEAGFLAFVHPDDREAAGEAIRDAIHSGAHAGTEFRVCRPDGRVVVFEQDMELVPGLRGAGPRLVGAAHDVTERREAENRIRTLAYVDRVTGLPNRTQLEEHLRHAITAAKRYARTLAILFIDIDHFKRINDTWGHAVGDDVLRRVAARLDRSLRECDLVTRKCALPVGETLGGSAVARLGGDEFVVLLPEVRRAEDAVTVARRIIDVLAEPFSVSGTEVYVTCSIGISVYPDDGTDAAALLKHADGAMYEVKSSGRNGYRYFTSGIQERAFARLDLEARLRRALDRDEFLLHYQPRLDLRTGHTLGAEALVRWADPEHGLVSPADFIPVAEETGLIVDLGNWVFDTAFAQARRWRDNGPGALRVSVNLSVAQMRHPDLFDTVRRLLDEHRLDPPYVEIELTESLLMDDVEGHLEVLRSLDALGVCLSIDDFGTGYSSLAYLKRLPVDYLKIDRGFVAEMDRDADDAAIVGGTVSLAHSLRLKVVAEGVEREAQAQQLTGFGCEEAQGFLYAPAMPAAAFDAWLRERNGQGPGLAASKLERLG